MKLSRKSEYACLAIKYLAETYGHGNIRMFQIAEAMSIPKKYLEQILLQLKGAAIVRSSSGTGGGYELARHPREISIAEVVRLIDGPIAPVKSASHFFYERTPLEQDERLLKVFKEVRDMVSDKLENTSFFDLL